MKYTPYSFSKINTWTQCPRKFKYQYIDKIKIEETSIPLSKGWLIHALLENAEDPKKIKSEKEYKKHVEVLGQEGTKEAIKIFKNFLNSKAGKKFFGPDSLKNVFRELKLGLDPDLRFYDYDSYTDPKLLLRGYIDSGYVLNDRLLLLDWKTGKVPEEPNWGQLLYYSIAMFDMMPYDEIILAYVYIEHEKIKFKKVYRKDIDKYKKGLMDTIDPIEQDTKFEKNETALCDWCKFQDICMNSDNSEDSVPWEI